MCVQHWENDLLKESNLLNSLYCTRTKRLEIIAVGNEILKVNTLRSHFDLDLETLFCGSLDIIDRKRWRLIYLSVVNISVGRICQFELIYGGKALWLNIQPPSFSVSSIDNFSFGDKILLVLNLNFQFGNL